MEPFVWTIVAVGAILSLLFGGELLRRWRRLRLMVRPFPPAWEEILHEHVALYRHLPAPLKEQLHADIHVFLDEKRFEGCGGLKLTDEMRVVIAGEACMLLLNRKSHFFRKLKTILVYPTAYEAKSYTAVGTGYIEGTSARLGESSVGGTLVLAWDHAEADAENGADGHNVVLHEFAHQLDQEDGTANGAPILASRTRYADWARVLGHEYAELCDQLEHHRRTVLDPYGATNPAEFFAVATETFFEKPEKLRRKEPELYDQLAQYYQVDPAEWL